MYNTSVQCIFVGILLTMLFHKDHSPVARIDCSVQAID